jgi:hypothetical protein
MSQITTDQMAQLLLGIARAQLAIADAVESSKAGFKSTHLRPNVESASRIKMNRPPVLEDFPSKLLLQMLGRNPPTLEAVTRELNMMLGAGDAGGADSLDMTR